MDDGPSVTETDGGGVYEMDRQTNRQKYENATEIDQIPSFCFCGTWSVHPFHRNFL